MIIAKQKKKSLLNRNVALICSMDYHTNVYFISQTTFNIFTINAFPNENFSSPAYFSDPMSPHYIDIYLLYFLHSEQSDKRKSKVQAFK